MQSFVSYISVSECCKFFLHFLDVRMDRRDEYIYLSCNITELNRVAGYYNAVGLHGCCGSVDIVHVKWSSCPAGNYNWAKGKEGYPMLGFKCITDFNLRVLSRPIFGGQEQQGHGKDRSLCEEHTFWLF
jgi:hypothetical protein